MIKHSLLLLPSAAILTGSARGSMMMATSGKKNKMMAGKKTPAPVAAPASAPNSAPNSGFHVCQSEFAYCAFAECWVLDLVAYCNCEYVRYGDSISVPFATDQGNICDLLEQGQDESSFTVSTFTVPPEEERETLAIYTCPAGSMGAYAQCDGGFCFKSTSNATFPYFGWIREDEIICSCPITYAPEDRGHAYQVGGPYPCDESEFTDYCTTPLTMTGAVQNGATIRVGAPPGSASLLSAILEGEPVAFNMCQEDD
eukprot:CAMPEP_0168752664 /NCGR_PEP_ID=MMETSP0724-20121128/18516_1 /TAXON_ID=265536 /ORGANISM="Amphiprora sp., Strain CCMP467" /LENGTH=255 /DNA_ID=CAMNT_0008800947 /DNA_START=41 /DNA_END=808 /DNA_ORIENTATION=+